MMHRREDNPNAKAFGPVLVEYGNATTEVDKQYVDDCINDGNMELFRWYREHGDLVLIYHWTN
jgi:hypothetical protein